MPRLVPGGPDLPAALLHALEDDRLVIFCGAGISIDTGLPSFEDLVKEAATGCNLALDGTAGDAFRACDFDKALDLLERKEGRGGRLRAWIADRLVRAPEGPDAALALHRALLDLARRPDGGYRLVTTNFDDRFERAGLNPQEMEDAPRLAPPRFDRLRRVVFLHGRIRKCDPSSHAELVLTSRDFGNAYLRDGWAARFVLELLREFHLLLVGYSLSDPVLRYLVDAIAPDSRPAGQFWNVWALAKFDPDRDGNEGRKKAEWQAKNVEPILYRSSNRDHSKLRETLVEWARRHRGGLEARARVALEAMRTPFDPSRDNEALANVVWALAEESGRTARAVLDAVRGKDPRDTEKPHPSWLLALLSAEVHDPRATRDPGASCKLVALPKGDEALRSWFLKLLGDVAFLREVVASNPDFPIGWSSVAFSKLRHDHLPDVARRFWDAYFRQAKYREISRLPRDKRINIGELDWFTRMSILDAFSPVVKSLEHSGAEQFRRILSKHLPRPEPLEPARLAELAAFELDFASPDTVRKFTHFLATGRVSNSVLIQLLDELTSLLVEHCRLSELVDRKPATSPTHLDLESLDPNLGYQDREPWCVLVRLLTRCLLAAIETDSGTAEAIIGRWWLIWQTTGFRLFARLWLWGVAKHPKTEVAGVLSWLQDEPERLWTPEWRRELRLVLLRRAKDLSVEQSHWLIEAIVHGRGQPEYLRNNTDDAEWLADLLLEALHRSGVEIPERFLDRAKLAASRVEEIEQARTKRIVEPRVDELGPLGIQVVEVRRRDRLDDVETMSARDIARAIGEMPEDREASPGNALADALTRSPHAPSTIAEALLAEGESRSEVWRSFWFGLFHGNATPARDLEALVDLVQKQPEALPEAALVTHAQWLEAVARQELEDVRQATFLRAWDLAWQRAGSDAHLGAFDAPNLTTAINSDAGALAEALIARLSASKPTRGAKLPDWFAKRAHRILEGEGRSRQLATICLAAALSFLFAVDPDWTRAHLLPLFDPACSPDLALRVWEAWLRAPRLDAELIQAIAPALMKMAGRARDLEGVWPATFPSLLVEASMLQPTSFPKAALVDALRQLGPELLAQALARLASDLETAGEKAAEYWRSYIGPWFETYWPGEQEFRQGTVGAAANRLLLHTREAFPEALATLRKLGLVYELPGDDPEFDSILCDVAEALGRHGTAAFPDVPGSFPKEFVMWLSTIIGRAQWRHFYFDEIRAGLKRLPQETPGLVDLINRLR